ncbi:MAG: hydantoinase/oxoprolinase family protein [Anaerolineae bacterium]|nr:hydantoinase/oxoprolinase family protein [Anaerolineae bacterium]
MHIALGIDTGGTYTDAVLINHETGAVLASAKALTTYHDLSVGIGQAVARVLDAVKTDHLRATVNDIVLVGLSTTLATNAIVEGRGSRVCLILIGYDSEFIRRRGCVSSGGCISSEGFDLITPDVVYVDGGHDGEGNERAPLDEAAVREAIAAHLGRVDAFAVSGYFGVRNPEHELRVRALIQDAIYSYSQNDNLAFPVTCGHELTTRLDAVRRATTAALNARLIPLLRDLIATVRQTLDGAGIHAPLMVVKGDGSLVRADWAMQRPIETILSGPAASVVGAWHLAGRGDAWVVDVGGTTTDIAVLRDGQPRLNPEGARVGSWRTMVEAIDVHTVGLGGDSHVRLDGSAFPGSGGVTIGPQRAVPLSLLAVEHAQVLDELRAQAENNVPVGLVGQFVLAQRPGGTELGSSEQELARQLALSPRSFNALVHELGYGYLVRRQIDALVAQQLAIWSSFTPTDALHVLGRFAEWNVEAARLGAGLLAAQLGLSAVEFCERVMSLMSDRVAAALVEKVMVDEAGACDWSGDHAASAMLARALGHAPDSDLACWFALRQPIVAVGAPVAAYMPRAAERLHTELIIPEHSGVANAVGAVVGGVVQRQRVLIQPMDFEAFYRLHLPDGVHDFAMLQESVDYAGRVVSERVERLARESGAQQVELRIERRDLIAPVRGDWGQEVFVGAELIFTAVGRPAIA